MKKSILYGSALLIFGLVGCDDTSDLGKMQVNEQEQVMAAEGVTVNLTSPVSGSSISLADYGDELVPVMTYVADPSVPPTATLEFDMDIAKSQDFATPITIQLTPMGNDTYGIKGSDWDDIFRHLFGKAPTAKDNYIRIAGYVNVDQQHSRVGGPDTWFGQKSISVTPVDLGIQIEEAYYLVGNFNDWTLSQAVKFDHSDQSPYDDPVFTLALDIPANFATDGWWFKIVPESAYKAQSWDGLFGPAKNGDDSLEGVLFVNGEAGCLKIAGQYLFTINMLDQTYSVTQAIPYLYTPGGGNEWSFGSGNLMTWNYADYFGFAHLNGEFKFTDRPEWGGMEWSYGGEEGKIALGAPGNIPGPANGLYWMNVNIGALTYSYLPIHSIGIVGGFPGNNWASDFVELTPSEDLLTWTGEITFANADIEWKIRTNGDWGDNPNFGGPLDDLTYNSSANIKAPGVGTYTVVLDITKFPYSMTFTAK